MFNCSNNIATDIDMCHLICIILADSTAQVDIGDRRLRGGMPNPCCAALCAMWALPRERERKKKPTCKILTGRTCRTSCAQEPGTVSRLSWQRARPFRCPAVCLYFCKFIDNWQFEMATSTRRDKRQTEDSRQRRDVAGRGCFWLFDFGTLPSGLPLRLPFERKN